MVIEALFIGLIAGFLFYELTGVSPGGVVAPGYIALAIVYPERILVTVALAVVTWALVTYASRYLLLYGRRTLLFALLLGFALKVVTEQVILPLPSMPLDLRSVGYIIPGLVANEMRKQGVMPTLFAMTIVTAFTYLLLIALGYL